VIASRSNLGDERLSSLLGQSRPRSEWSRSTLSKQIAQSLRRAERFVSTACSERIRPDDDRHRLAMTCDRHLVAGENPVEDLRERSASLAGSHGRHDGKCTVPYASVQLG
jgi:hypothetical protein